jgi:hypothetical protein
VEGAAIYEAYDLPLLTTAMDFPVFSANAGMARAARSKKEVNLRSAFILKRYNRANPAEISELLGPDHA